jgi:hypothetical protein
LLAELVERVWAPPGMAAECDRLREWVRALR